jgi:integrase
MISSSPVGISQPSVPSTIRLFSPERLPVDEQRHPTQPSVDWTLSEIFERAFVPLWIKPQALADKTTKVYREALDHWSRIAGDPPICQIDDWTASHFVEKLLEHPGRKGEFLSIATVVKHCTALNKLLDFCGPKAREKKRRRNLSLLELPPWIDAPQPDDDPPDGDFTIEEARAIYEAASKMTAPRQVVGVAVPRWWQALIVVACYTGLRIGQLMRLEYANLRPPYINVMGRVSKKRKGKRQYLAAEALQEIEAIRSPRRYIFELPTWEKNPRWLQACFERLLNLAEIPKERQFKFHGFRKLHATLVADTSADGEDGIKTAQKSLGHGDEATTRGHYVNGRVQDRIVAAAIERLPSPRPKAKSAEDPRQTKLGFE